MIKIILMYLITTILWSPLGLAISDSSESSFLEDLYNKEFKPILNHAFDKKGKKIALYGSIATLLSFALDDSIYESNQKHPQRYMDSDTSSFFSNIGDGKLGAGIALGQLYWDPLNGRKHIWTLVLTSSTHFLSAAVVQRDRPHGKLTYLPFPSSFPSGHSSSAFATAASLNHAYGTKVGIPAYLFAGGIAASRIQQEAHWLSDIVAGASLGIFWANAVSQLELENSDKKGLLYPSFGPEYISLNYLKNF